MDLNIIIISVCLSIIVSIGVGVYFLSNRNNLCKDISKWNVDDRNNAIRQINKIYQSKPISYLQTLSNTTLQNALCNKKILKDDVCEQDASKWTGLDRDSVRYKLSVLYPSDKELKELSYSELQKKICSI